MVPSFPRPAQPIASERWKRKPTRFCLLGFPHLLKMPGERDTKSISGFMHSAAPKCFGKAAEVELKTPLALLKGNRIQRGGKKSAQQKVQRNVDLQCPGVGETEPAWALLSLLSPPAAGWMLEQSPGAEALLAQGGSHSAHSVCSPSSHS